MKVQILPDDFEKERYNKAAKHPLQAWEWGEARKETGVEVIRLGEFNGDKLTNVFQLSLHKVPHTPWNIGYLPRSVTPSTDVIEQLKRIGQDNNCIFIKLEPYEKKVPGSTFQVLRSTESPHPLFPKWTQMLDITPAEDELMKNMKSKTRYNVRLAERKGVTVQEESNEKGFNTFLTLYFETTKRQNYFGHDKRYHEIIWKHLKDNIAHILIAYYNDEPLAAYELFHFHDTLYYPYGGSSTEYREVMASNLIMWEAIKLGKKLDAKTFDMWGSLPPDYDKSKDWSGFTRFKEGYGTEFVELAGSYDLVMSQILYKFYNVAYKIRNLYLGI